MARMVGKDDEHWSWASPKAFRRFDKGLSDASSRKRTLSRIGPANQQPHLEKLQAV